MIKVVICPECGIKNSSKNSLCKECDASLILNNRYRLIKILGKNVGITYLAFDTATKKGAIVKELSFKRIDRWKTEELFEREVKVLSRLEHKAIPHFIDNFSAGVGRNQKNYLIMEYIKGINLEREREEKTYNIPEIFEIVLEIADILEYLHSFNPPVIHRDLKPSNLLRDKNNNISLIDFGSVKDIVNPDSGATITGTFGYMAPEQFSGRTSKKSDFYSLGVIALVLLTKQEPEDMMDGDRLIWKNHLKLENSIQNSNFKLLLEKLLEKSEEKRISSVKEIQNIIDNRKEIVEYEGKKSLKGSKLINNRYKLVKKIKSEGIVDIFIAKDTQNGDKSVLVNRLIIDDEEDVIDGTIIQEFKKEAEKLKRLNYKGIPKYLEIEYTFKNDKHTFYSVQKRSSGNSFDKIVRKNMYEELNLNKNISKIIVSILETLKYLESVSTINGNITSKNILVKKDLSTSLINFGIVENVARKIDEDNNISAYLAPEKLEDHETVKSDQYSVGVALIHLITKKDPNEIQTFYKRIQFKDHSKFGKHINDIVSTLTDVKPRYRLENISNTIEQLNRFSKKGFFEADYSNQSFDTGFSEQGIDIDNFDSALVNNYTTREGMGMNREVFDRGLEFDPRKSYERKLQARKDMVEGLASQGYATYFFFGGIILIIVLFLYMNGDKKLEENSKKREQEREFILERNRNAYKDINRRRREMRKMIKKSNSRETYDDDDL